MTVIGDAGARVRNALRGWEFTLPPAALAPLVRHTSIVDNPYTSENNRLKTIFIHIPKTAGTSLADAIFAQPSAHIPLVRYYLFDRRRFHDYFKFCVVRNPYDRARSAFYQLRTYVDRATTPDTLWARDSLSKEMSFSEFVLRMQFDGYRRRALNQTHFRPQYEWASIPGLGLCVDKVYRFERLSEASADLSRQLGFSVQVPRLRTSYSPADDTDYTPELRKVIARAYAQDFRLFGYPT